MIKSNKSPSPSLKQNSKPNKPQKLQQSLKIIKMQLSPLSRTNKNSTSKNNSKGKNNYYILTSTRYTSPNSCQSSGLISKKQSREKKNAFKNKNKEGIKQIKKKKRRMSFDKGRECQKENLSMKLNSKLSEQFKITRWKKKVLREFMVRSRDSANDNHSIYYLENQLKQVSNDSTLKSRTSNSFFGYLIGDKEGNRKVMLTGITRIITIDWMYLIAASLMLNRETVHLAVHYMDSYSVDKDINFDNIHIIAAAALLLSVKQEQRELQSAYLSTICMSQKFNVLKDQVLQSERLILTKLNFRLKSNTLAFWIDYFSLKWDTYIDSFEGQQAMREANFNLNIRLRSSDGDCYRLYREIVQLADVSLMFGQYSIFHKSKLSLACIYLVIRIQAQKTHQGALSKQDQNLFKVYHKLFMKKASPIFKDPFRINEIFNAFLTQICQFEITQIIPCIKLIANFLQVDFCYSIDEKAIEQTKSYEDFIRRMTYSYQMKDFCLQKVC